MRLLLVDAGNARLKWAFHERDAIGALHVAEYEPDVDAAVARLRDAAAGAVDAVAVSNVAGPAIAAALDRAFGGHVQDLWYASSTRAAVGVRNAYARPEQLGVDRWAALVGAYGCLRRHNISAPLCVVDAGTALTIDALEADGTHLGGLILPGLALQRSLLLDSTADIAKHAQGAAAPSERHGVFATDTATAVTHSGAFACAATIDRCADELATRSRRPIVMLTGGDAAALAPWLASDFEICPNLVLEGLALLFEQRSLA